MQLLEGGEPRREIVDAGAASSAAASSAMLRASRLRALLGSKASFARDFTWEKTSRISASLICPSLSK